MQCSIEYVWISDLWVDSLGLLALLRFSNNIHFSSSKVTRFRPALLTPDWDRGRWSDALLVHQSWHPDASFQHQSVQVRVLVLWFELLVIWLLSRGQLVKSPWFERLHVQNLSIKDCIGLCLGVLRTLHLFLIDVSRLSPAIDLPNNNSSARF